MSVLKKKRIIKLSLISTAAIASVGTISSYVGLSESNSNFSKVSDSRNDARATDSKTTASSGDSDVYTKFTKNSNTIDNTKMTLYPFDMTTKTSESKSSDTSYDTSKAIIPTILQNTAYDDTNNTGYATFVKYDKKDAIAKFTSVNTIDADNSTTTESKISKYAGQASWVVTSDDLIKLAYKAVNSNDLNDTTNYTLTFKSMLFSTGGNDSPPSLFVVASIKKSNDNNDSINGSYLFQINWSNANFTKVPSSDQSKNNAGYYRLAARLSSGTDFIDYNYLVMDAISTNTMQALYLPKISNGGAEVNDGKYVTVSNSLFGSSSSSSTAHNIIIKNYSGSMDKDKTYVPIYANRINSKFFFVYQVNDGSLSKNSLLLIKSNQLTDTANSDVEISTAESNFNKLDLSKLSSSSTASTNTSFKTNIYYKANSGGATDNINFVVSVPGQSQYLYANLEVNSFQFTTNPTVYDGYTSGGFISQVIPYYSLNSNDISGYYALTSTNQVISLDTNFKLVKVIYDFNSSYYQLGNIYKIYTIPGEASNIWYAQMTDGTFAKMSGSTLVGQWDKLNSITYYEKTVDFTIKSQDQVDSSVFFRKVVNDSNNGFDSNFLSFLGSSTAWKSFLDYDVNSVDPQVNGTPSVTVKIFNQDNAEGYYFKKDDVAATNPLNQKGNNTLVLQFYQNLRKINNGVLTSESKQVLIGSYTYTFYYGAAKINGQVAGSYTYNDYSNYQSQTKLSIPQYVLDMYPSKIASLITSKDSEYTNFINSFLSMQNIVSPIITASGNDTNGTLTVNVTVPYSWASDDSSSADTNKSWVFTFGTSSSPFFKSNPFGFTDSTNTVSNASVTPIDSTYAANKDNATKMSTLTNKYSTQLASKVSKIDLYNDFLVLGSAFSNTSYISSGLIIPITADNVDQYMTVVPDDANGSVYISITFPKIGNDTDYVVSFTTPSIFMKDAAASQSVYFSWKSGSNIDLSKFITNNSSSKAINDINASSVGQIINTTTNKSDLIQLLGSFATFSSYYANLITQSKLTVSATWDDKQGYLNISLNPSNGTTIPGLDSSTFLTMTFYGFKTNDSGTSNISTLETTSNFNFGNYSADNSKSASSVTESDILASGLLSGNSNLSSWISSGLASLSLTPSDSTGTLQVSVTLKNYSESNTISPSKTFTTNIGGFAVTGQNTNMIVWKTNTDSTLSGKLPSALIEAATSGEYSDGLPNVYLNRLRFFANISSVLNSQLTANPGMVTTLTMQGDDNQGTLTVSAIIVQNGISTVYSSTISGLATTPSLQPTVTFNYTDSSNNPVLTSLKSQVPSSISTNNSDLLKLFTISSSSPNYRTNIDLTYNDIGGNLTIKVTVYDSSNNVLSTATQTYTGFKTVVDNSKTTNWTYVAISIVIPVLVLMIPIFSYGFIQQRRDIRAISRKLDSRLKEEQERERRLRLKIVK